MSVSRRQFLQSCLAGGASLLAASPKAWAFEPVNVENPLGSYPEPRLGKDLSRPVPLRQHVHLGLRPQRYAHVPPAGVRPQRRHDPQRTELRPRALRRSVRQ